MHRVLILDIKNGNLNSLFNIIKKRITKNVVIGSTKKEIEHASHIIFPGVGAFNEVMKKLDPRKHCGFHCIRDNSNKYLQKIIDGQESIKDNEDSYDRFI